MEQLHKQVRRAWSRMQWQAFFAQLAWCWFVALAAAAVAIGIGKLWPPAVQTSWAAICLSAALGGGLLAATVWNWSTRKATLDAAVELDRRCGLKERVSSTLALSPEELQTDAGQALAHDAVRRLQGVDVSQQFRVRLNRRAWLPLAPAAVAFALALGVDGRTPPAPAATGGTATAQQIKKSTETLAKKLEEKRQQAEEAGLEEADALLKELQDRANLIASKPENDRKKALVELNELVRDAEKRREQVASSREIKQQLSQLKNLQQGPAQKLGEALKNGDLDKAIEELDKLRQQLATDQLDDQQRAQLAQQIDELRKTMEQSVAAQKEAQEQLRQQIEQAKQQGNLAQADKLQQQLDKMEKQAAQSERMSQLAQQLQSASECMSQGDCQQAAEALGQMSEQLSKMQGESEELEMLDDALAEFADAKNSMNCDECDGDGCQSCQTNSPFGSRQARMARNNSGRGEGLGDGRTTDMRNNTSQYDSRVKQEVRKGAMIVAGTADGPNRKGQAQEQIQAQFNTAEQQTAEALSGQRLPHDYRDHAKKYFDTLREGQ